MTRIHQPNDLIMNRSSEFNTFLASRSKVMQQLGTEGLECLNTITKNISDTNKLLLYGMKLVSEYALAHPLIQEKLDQRLDEIDKSIDLQERKKKPNRIIIDKYYDKKIALIKKNAQQLSQIKDVIETNMGG